MKRVILTACLLLAGCTNESATIGALQGAGYTDIAITGFSWFSCAKDDISCTGFSAVGPTGHYVKGAVGCGLLGKGCTIRFK